MVTIAETPAHRICRKLLAPERLCFIIPKLMQHEFSRTELLIGKPALKKLRTACVAVFGIGGVGSYAVEGLARAGVGKIVMIDDDLICLTNINRQLHATHKTIGKAKVFVMKERLLEINPKITIETFQEFYLPATGGHLIREDFDYIIDAVDTVTAKIDIILKAKAMAIPLISCMGSGKRSDPTAFQVGDLFNTTTCPLCRVMRVELRKRGVTALKVVYSQEPIRDTFPTDDPSCSTTCICPRGSSIRKCSSRRDIPGTISFIPAIAGMIAAAEVITNLIKEDKT